MTDRVEEGIRKPLLITSGILPDDEEDCDESEESADDSRRPANSFGDAYRLLTPSVKVSIYQSSDLFLHYKNYRTDLRFWWWSGSTVDLLHAQIRNGDTTV